MSDERCIYIDRYRTEDIFELRDMNVKRIYIPDGKKLVFQHTYSIQNNEKKKEADETRIYVRAPFKDQNTAGKVIAD